MDHQHDRALALGLQLRQVAVDLALGRVIRDAFGDQTRVVLGNDRGLRVVVLQQRQQRGGGRGGTGELGKPVDDSRRLIPPWVKLSYRLMMR